MTDERNDCVAVRRASGRLFTPLETLPQAWMMLVAGYETSAVTVAQTLFCVARCPAAEEAPLREIDGHSADSVPTQDTLTEWPFALVRPPCTTSALGPSALGSVGIKCTTVCVESTHNLWLGIHAGSESVWPCVQTL